MPRTKKVQAPKSHKAKESKEKELVLKAIDSEEMRVMALLDAEMEKILQDIEIFFVQERMAFKLAMMNRTIREIDSNEVDISLNTTKSSKKANQTLGRTMSKRSLSVGCEDEGYTTAESTRGTTSGGRSTRQSRSKTKTTAKPSSRSLSRNTTKKVAAFRTPSNKQPPNTNNGSITPKCKPNTPQMFVRRPKVGELAWSNAGSPLLTSHTFAAEDIPNINIPLPDGNLMSLLPQQNVRVSQIPMVDHDTRRHLEILRDNLIKVCQEYQVED